MEEILYVKIEQNIPVNKSMLTFKDISTMYCTNKKLVQNLEKEVFYALPENGPQKTAFTIEKVYEGIHKHYPKLQIENIGERDFIVDYEKKKGKDRSKAVEYVKACFTALVIFFGAAFTIMTFNEDVSVAQIFNKVYELIMGTPKQGGSVLEVCYAIGLPIGIIVFYNHFKKSKKREDPTPIQIEMSTYEEQVNKAIIKTASREGKTIDVN